MEAEHILYAVKIGDEDWQEQIITTHKDRFEAAKKWAIENGFHMFREAVVDGSPPDFIATLNTRKKRR